MPGTLFWEFLSDFFYASQNFIVLPVIYFCQCSGRLVLCSSLIFPLWGAFQIAVLVALTNLTNKKRTSISLFFFFDIYNFAMEYKPNKRSISNQIMFFIKKPSFYESGSLIYAFFHADALPYLRGHAGSRAWPGESYLSE